MKRNEYSVESSEYSHKFDATKDNLSGNFTEMAYLREQLQVDIIDSRIKGVVTGEEALDLMTKAKRVYNYGLYAMVGDELATCAFAWLERRSKKGR